MRARLADGDAATRQPGPLVAEQERRQARKRTLSDGCQALLPTASQGMQSWRTVSNLFARPLCLRAFVVWSVVAGYDYQLIVMTKCRRYQTPAPEKLFAPARLFLAPGPTGPLPPSARMQAARPDNSAAPGWAHMQQARARAGSKSLED
jgi:hypothetical protein